MQSGPAAAELAGHREAEAPEVHNNSSVILEDALLEILPSRRGFRTRLVVREAFLENPHVELAPVTATTADRFARIAAALRAKGTAIPANDIWVAATAMETGAELLSFDAHFASVEGLAWDDPAG